jgi:hypothetical protein
MKLVQWITQQKQTAEQQARAEYVRLLTRAAANGGELSEAETGKVAGAAEHLGYSPEDVEKHLAALTESISLAITAADKAQAKADLQAARKRSTDYAEEVKGIHAEIDRKRDALTKDIGQKLTAFNASATAEQRLVDLASKYPWMIENPVVQ